jgi:hypothetical protein
MRLTTLMTALAVTLAFAQSAHAREHRYRHGVEGYTPWGGSLGASLGDSWGASSGPSTSGAADSGRPRAWCGWQMRQLVGGDPGPQFNLARNWANLGARRSGGYRRHRRLAASRRQDRRSGRRHLIIESGNDDNRVRTRPLSISGAIAIRWS